MRPLRILHVIARLNVGGTATHVAQLTSRLDPARFECRLAVGTAPRAEGDMFDLRPDLRADVGDRLAWVPGLGPSLRPGADARATAGLWRLMGEFRPDIVHTHTAKAGALGRLTARARRVPAVVHTFHGTVFSGHFPPVIGSAFALTEKALARLTDVIIAVSPAVAADLAARGIGPGKVRVVPLGLDLDAFASLAPIQSPAPPSVTLVARLAPVKDVPLFLEAVEMVRRQIPVLEARVIGDGPLATEVKRQAPPWVTFLGNRADLPALFASTGVVALSSRSEGSPVALIEALAAARPVAAVPVGGVVDLLRSRPGAVLAHQRSAPALAEAIAWALTEPSIPTAAAMGRARVIEEFGAARLIRDMEDLYQRASDASRR